MGEANLHSLQSVADLDDALGRYADRATKCLERVEANLRWQLSELAQRREEAEGQVRACRSKCASGSDQDDEEADREYREAKDRLQQIRRWERRTLEAEQTYRAVASRFERTLTDQIPKAQVTLRAKSADVSAYLAVQLDGDLLPSSQTVSPRADQGAAPNTETPQLDAIVRFSLPAGFRWVSLEHISRRDDLGPKEGFSKVSENDMRRVFGTLRRQLLPYLQLHMEANAGTFREIDGLTAAGIPKARQLAYEVFFGDGAIVLDWFEAYAAFSVTNGRHRIKVARDLGWPAVPARVAQSPGATR